ncbi:MAG TPA: hypothetical protein VFT71_00470 [Candidatus Nitrosocosmicus sp.]|nr:hypothetical protein [Candidatus Nitrosocosmicus sp.]
MILSRKQKEALVIKLANDGKTTREIAKEVHVSLKDIGSIIRRYTGDDNAEAYGMESLKKHSLESNAFQMFKEGKSNIDVAIALDIPAEDVITLRQDYQRMLDLDCLVYLYRDLGEGLRFFVELYQRLKEEGLMTMKDIAEMARAQVQIRDLGTTINRLYDEIGRLNLIKMDLRDKITLLTDFQSQCR